MNNGQWSDANDVRYDERNFAKIEIWVSYNSGDDDSSLLGCSSVSTSKYLVLILRLWIRRNIAKSCQGKVELKKMEISSTYIELNVQN